MHIFFSISRNAHSADADTIQNNDCSVLRFSYPLLFGSDYTLSAAGRAHMQNKPESMYLGMA
jgi:hypothetical protein